MSEDSPKTTDSAPQLLDKIVFNALLRQANAKTRLAGKGFVESLIRDLEVDRDAAPLKALAAGPVDDQEFALLSEMAIRHWSNSNANSDELIELALFVDLATPYNLLAHLDLISADQFDKLQTSAVARVDELRAKESASAMAHAAYLASYFGDPANDEEAAPARLQFSARATSPMRYPLWQLITGIALMKRLAQLLSFVAGFRRELRVEANRDGISIEEKRHWLNRETRHEELLVPWNRLDSLRTSASHPALMPIVASATFAACIFVGIYFLFSGVRTGDSVALMLCAAFWLAGAAIELCARLVLPKLAKRIYCEIRSEMGSVACASLSRDDADALLAMAKTV